MAFPLPAMPSALCFFFIFANMVIYGISNTQILDAPVTQDARHEEEMMKSDFVRLVWHSETKTTIPVGAYIVPFEDGIKYRLVEPCTPSQEDEAKFRYEPEFQHPKMWLSKVPFRFRTNDTLGNSANQQVWDFTGFTGTILQYLVDAINEAFGFPQAERFNYIICGKVDTTVSVSFSATDILSAISAVANACAANSCEWHLDWENRALYFGQICTNHGEESVPVLKVGENVGRPQVSSAGEGYYNVFYPQGSTRNMSAMAASGENVSTGIRLGLNKSKYPNLVIDTRADANEPKQELGLVFDDVFPHVDLYAYNIRKKTRDLLDDDNKPVVDHYEGSVPVYRKYSVWYMRLAYPVYRQDGSIERWKDYELDVKRQVLDGHKPIVAFKANTNEGALSSSLLGHPTSGEGFEIHYHDADGTMTLDDGTSPKKGDYEIIFVKQGENNLVVPSTESVGLIPRGEKTPSLKGNIVVLYNVAMGTAEVEAAQAELAERAMAEIRRLQSDQNNYTISSYPHVFETSNPNLYIGRKVVYDDGNGYVLNTRVIKMVTNLDYNFLQEITVGNSKIAGPISQLKEDVKTIMSGNFEGAGLNETQVRNIIRNYTEPRFLRKDVSDSTPHKLTMGEAEVVGDASIVGDATIGGSQHVGGDQRVQGEARFGADPSDSLLDGRGTIIEDDRVQTTNMQVRGTLTVLDMVASQIHSLDGYYYFSDTMKVAAVEATGEANVYKVSFEKQHDNEHLKFYPADILLSIKTDLSGVTDTAVSEGGNRVPKNVTTTSWCRVLATSAGVGDDLWVTVQCLDDGKGNIYPAPQQGAYIARRGNANTADGSLDARRASWCISVEEGRITYYINQTGAGTRDENIGLAIGRLPDIAPIRGVGAVGEIGLYCKTLLYDRAVSVHWKGDVSYQQVDEGAWSAERAAKGEYRCLREHDSGMGKTFVMQSKVTHNGGTWLCETDKTAQEPKAGATGWTLIAGGDTIIRRRVQYAATATRDLEEGGLSAPVVWHDDQSQCGYDAFCPYLWARTLGYTIADPGGSVIEEPHLIGVWGETGELVRAEISDPVLSIGVGADGILQTAAPVPFETSAVLYKGETALPLNLSRCQVVSEGLPAQLAVTLSQKDTHTLGIAVVLRDGLDFTAATSRMVKIRVDGTDEHTGIAYNRFVVLEVKGNRKGADGEKGDPGKDGRGILRLVEEYAAGTSGSVPPTSWSGAIPQLNATDKYLWNRERVQYTDGTYGDYTPAAVIGSYGADGRGIRSVTERYLASASDTGVTASTAGWTASVQAMTADKPYLWNYEVVTYTDDTTSITTPAVIGRFGKDGAKGEKGEDGRGIDSVVEYYAVSDSRTEAPTAWQTNTIPAQSAAKPYLWNYEEIRYTTGAPTLTPPAVIGTMGEDGRGISSVVEHYLATTASTGVTRSTAGWGTGVQHPSAEKPWLWNYEKLTYTDGSTSMTDPVIIGHYGQDGRDGLDGLQGPKGDQGIPGVKGADGKTSYTHIAYADTQTGGGFSQSSEGKAYIGIYVDFVQADSTDPTKYRWTLIKGADGADGLPGAKGADGKTPYFHTAYSSSADGTVNFHLSDPTGRAYIGTYTDYTQADSTSPSKYKWVLIKGDKGDKGEQGLPGAKGADGRGVASVVEEYAVSASNTTAPTSWGTSVPTMTAAAPYLWNRERFVYTDGTQSGYTPPAVIGSLGADGKGIKSVTERYLATAAASGVTASTAGWTTSVQSMTAAKPYLWNYERVVYTDNSATATAPVIIGHYGKDGAKGEKGDKGPKGDQGIPGVKGADGKYREHVYCLMKSDALAPARPLIDAQNWSQHSATAVGYTPVGGSAVSPSSSSAVGGVNVSANNAANHPSGSAYLSLRTEGWHGWVRVNGDVAASNYDYANRASLYSASAGQIYCMVFWDNKPQSPSKEWPVVYESFRWVDPGAEQPYGDFSAPVVHSRYGQDAVVYTLVPSRSAVTRAWNGQQAELDTASLSVSILRTEGTATTAHTLQAGDSIAWGFGHTNGSTIPSNGGLQKSISAYAAILTQVKITFTPKEGGTYTLTVPVIDQGRKGDRGYPGCISRLFEGSLVHGQVYRNDTDKTPTEQDPVLYMDFVAVPVDTVQSGYLVWRAENTFTFANGGNDKDLTAMTASELEAYMNNLQVAGKKCFKTVDSNAASAFFTNLVAKNANIRMLTGSHFCITDNRGKVLAGMGNRTANDGKGYILWGGGETGEDAAFRMDADGTLHATTGEFSGLVKRKTLVLTAHNAASHIRKGYAPSSGQAQCLLFDLGTIPSEMCLYETETHTGNGGDIGGTTQSPAGWARGYPNMGEIPGWEDNCAYLELPTLVYRPSTHSTWMSDSILGWEAYKGWCAANGRNVNPGVAADPLADTVWADWCRKYRAERIRRAREMVGCRMTIYQESSFGVCVSGSVPEGMYDPSGSNGGLYQVRELLYNREFGGNGTNSFPHSFVELECRREVVYGAEHIYWTYTAGSCPVLDKEILCITDKT